MGNELAKRLAGQKKKLSPCLRKQEQEGLGGRVKKMQDNPKSNATFKRKGGLLRETGIDW